MATKTKRKQTATKSAANKAAVKKSVTKKTAAKRTAAKNVTTKTSVMTAPKSGVKVRMYRQGLGDCFLLAFPGQKGKPFYMLIDCGVIVGQIPGKRPSIGDVAAHIKAATEGRIDILVATHQHWDHLSGFVDAKDVFQQIKVGQVWFAWTENPKDSLAKQLHKKQAKAQAALRTASLHLTGSVKTSLGLAGDGMFATALENVVGFLGADSDGRTTESALQVLNKLSTSDPRYCDPSDESVGLPGVKDVRIYVLGPPHDEQKIKRYNDKKSDPQTYHISEFALDAQTNFLAAALDGRTELEGGMPKSPFDERDQIRNDNGNGHRYKQLNAAFEGPEAWRQVTVDWLRAVTGLALNLDNATNNTSLALAIELGPGGKVLLFPADAQVGNWLSWHDQPWKDAAGTEVTAEDLLARTVLYKVGHHGSHNATLRQRGLELMKHQDLVALVPLDRATAKKKKWPMPWPKLRTGLLEATKGRILQVDDTKLPADRDCPKDTDRAVWTKFQKAITGNEVYFELTIPG